MKLSLQLELGAHNPLLRKKSLPISSITKEIRTLATQMSDLMIEYDGVGIAAPQVGKAIRLIITTQRKLRSDGEYDFVRQVPMVNPEIVYSSANLRKSAEGCLSLPNIEGDVMRNKEIKVSYVDLKGQKKTIKLTDFDAAIVQHEIDHLNGILFIDRL